MIFLISVISGVTLRLVYQSIACLRQMIKHSMLIIGIEDLIFWIGAGLYVFVQIYHTSNGSVRWYFVLGIVSGALFGDRMVRGTGKDGKKNLRSGSEKNLGSSCQILKKKL